MLKSILKLGFFAISISCNANLLVKGSFIQEKVLSIDEQSIEIIPIENTGDAPLSVQIFQHDYIRNEKGERVLMPVHSLARSNANWISFGKKSVVIPPHSIYPFAYTVQVPKDSTLEGDYWSYLTIEPITQEDLFQQDSESISIKTIVRYGILVATRIKDSGVSSLKIAKDTISCHSNQTTYSLNVENNGTVTLNPKILLEIFDQKGKSLGHFSAPSSFILPTCTGAFDVNISTLPSGKYKAIALLDDEKNEVFASQLELTIP